jgi:hypothetical protein
MTVRPALLAAAALAASCTCLALFRRGAREGGDVAILNDRARFLDAAVSLEASPA